MTYEQFAYWIGGYITNAKDHDPKIIIEDIRNALSHVRDKYSQEYNSAVFITTQD